ncbi:DUF502 domain-containing protein [Marinobacterium sediminicola]|uniref:Uncharacterized membrane protein n=1 Tax=Marinobacterium sediminicola TaxID=518898 RepID=A0ABY1S4A0_9GAMM|nr:DUF502 domain-containing protein [Marinobacterium sediminicola]ULG69195.1 DUF502 domain-containing protein [Marinobacterium sediminicola]SMR78270.1 Uncharacterized membrane protein [Marinobacterium sediminicola]
MRLIVRLFFQGLLILLPAIITIYLVYAIFTALNNTLFSALSSLFQQLFPQLQPGLTTTLLAILCTLMIITLVGALASNFLGRFVIGKFEQLMKRIPLIKLLYNALRDLFHAFLGEDKRFEKPVMVSLDERGEIRVAGFITAEDLSHWGLEQDVAVYLPQSYNFAGNLIIVPASRVIPLECPASEVTTFIVSGGVSTRKENSSR